MLTIGITGQTGCGKTALLRRIEARGGCGVDCDALYYDLLRTDGALRAALTDAFGDVFLPNGTLDRKKLGGLVFQTRRSLIPSTASSISTSGARSRRSGQRRRRAAARCLPSMRSTSFKAALPLSAM